MGLHIHAEQLSRRLAFSLGALLLLVIMMIAQSVLSAKLHNDWQMRFGQALAGLAANAAVDAALNHDLVSLQVVLQDVAQSPRVALAQIHDVESNLLVQSGVTPSPHHLAQMPVYRAPISYQQSVVGTVSVYLERTVSPARPAHWQYVLLGVLLLCVVGFLLADWPSLVSFTPTERRELVEAEGERSIEKADPNTEEAASESSEAFVVAASSEVMIELYQFKHLKQTLSATRLEEVRSEFLNIAALALEVYGGQWAVRPQNTLEDGALVALFASPHSEADAIRIAAFFSALVNKAFVSRLARGGVRATVALQDTLCDLPQRPSAPLVLWLDDELADELSLQAEIEPLEQKWWCLSAFGRSHDELLSRQAEQLKQAESVT